MKKTLMLILLVGITISSIGCGKQESVSTEDASVKEEVVEVARNDWYGAYCRIAKLADDARSTIETLEKNNYNIVQGNPSDYWSDGYFSFTFNPTESKYLPYTQYINETDDWSIISEAVNTAVTADFELTDFTATRKVENQYSINWSGYADFDLLNKKDTFLTRTLKCTYDASHNWLQMLENTSLYEDNTPFEEDIFEYAELRKNTYVIQAAKTRLYCEYNDNGKIKTMYYSKLKNEPRDGVVLYDFDKPMTFNDYIQYGQTGEEPIKDTVIYDLSSYNPWIYHSDTDSIFLDMNNIDENWVLSGESIDEFIIYEDGVLLFRVRNKLTNEFEGFIISDVILEPIKNEEDGLFYDPVTNELTSMEEYEAKLKSLEGQASKMNELINSLNDTEDVEDIEDTEESEKEESIDVKKK